jgi:hypothetical protein
MKTKLLSIVGLMWLAACGTSPTSPTADGPQAAAPAATATGPAIQADHLTPSELTEHGWTCRVPPVPNRIVCMAPNQSFPVPGAPADRAPSFSILVFDGTGTFIGTQVAIRTDLYQGQLCESTGQSYIFRPVIGYYECLHTRGRA